MLHRMLPVVRGFPSGTFGQLVAPRGAGQVVRHHLLLSCSDKIRASFLSVLPQKKICVKHYSVSIPNHLQE